ELEHTADIAALDAAADLVNSRRPGGLLTPADGTSLALYGSDGRLIGGQGPGNADPIVRQTLADNTIHHQSRLGTMIAAVPVPDQGGGNYAVRASTATSEVYPKIALTWLGMLALELVILTLTWQLARWQARRLARPVETLAASASRLGDGDFTVRAQSSGIPEIDTAAAALNNAAARIGDLVDRERAVTAHASHQLRTPLAGLRLSLESALHTPGTDYPTATREAVAAADRLERTIDDLVMLARNHDRRTIEPPDISALLNDIEALWHGLLAKSGRSLQVITDLQLRPPRFSTAAIRQILTVLMDNAARHGAGRVTVHARETITTVAIDVSDEGVEGSIDGVLNRPPGDGHGIGLRLARSLAEAEGGRLLQTGRAPTTFTLFLPEDDDER
ncbi:MAG: Histidine kinase, partial [Mycobacterium sp.]|uniref:sensor histidine kinase n=1 Tax=Mycobacterium sp. TaxID=1785 RepID=UPI0026131D5D